MMTINDDPMCIVRYKISNALLFSITMSQNPKTSVSKSQWVTHQIPHISYHCKTCVPIKLTSSRQFIYPDQILLKLNELLINFMAILKFKFLSIYSIDTTKTDILNASKDAQN